MLAEPRQRVVTGLLKWDGLGQTQCFARPVCIEPLEVADGAQMVCAGNAQAAACPCNGLHEPG